MMKKRILGFAFALALIFAVSMAAFATEMPYDTEQHVTFSVTTSQTMNAADYNSGNLYDYMAERFNITLDVKPVPYANQDEKMRTLLATGGLPDTVCWLSFNAAEYQAYIESGVIAPLPDGWEEKYPNMLGMMKATGIFDLLDYQGKTYCVPHAVFYTFNTTAYSDNGVVPHGSVYYRKDWVEQLGLEPFGMIITRDQYKEYLAAAVEADLAGNGKTFGITSSPGDIINTFMYATDIRWNTFVRYEDHYEYGLLDPAVVEVIKELREMYQNNLIYADFYMMADSDNTYYHTGLSASKIDAGVCNTINWTRNGFKNTYASLGVEDFDVDAVMGMAALGDADGNWHGAYSTNYWTASIFNADIDPVTMDRILSIIDWLCTPEGAMICNMGVPDVDWTVDENGNYVSLMPKNDDGTPYTMWQNSMSYCVYRQLGVLADDFQLISPAFDRRVQELCADMYAAKQQPGAVIVPLDMKYTFYTSEAKNIMTVPYNDEIVRLMMSPNADVEAEWAKFIESYRNLWEPVLNEINAALFD